MKRKQYIKMLVVILNLVFTISLNNIYAQSEMDSSEEELSYDFAGNNTDNLYLSNSEIEKINDYVDSKVKNTDPSLIISDPNLEGLRKSLIELKQAYKDKSINELVEMLRDVESEDDYEELLGINTSNESNLSANNVATTFSSMFSTSTESVLADDIWQKTQLFSCAKYEQNSIEYSEFGNRISTLSKNYIIPGLARTNVDGNMCYHMVPQGICELGNYILVSAYCSEGEHNSVIYVMSKSGLTFRCTLVTDTKCHLGGIAYDGSKYLWVCDSDNMQMRAYNMEYFSGYLSAGINDIYKSFEIFCKAICQVDIKPSFCTYFDDMLWVGSFYSNEPAEARGYTVSGNSLIARAKIEVPAACQGMAWNIINGKYYCLFSTSYTRTADSMTYSYTVTNYSDRYNANKVLSRSYENNIKLPSMIEGIWELDNNIYALFESAANKYRGSDGNGLSTNPCDRICVFDYKYIYK